MSKVTLQELGLGADDLSAIGKLSESGMTPDEIADAVEKAHELVGQDLVTQTELTTAIEGIDALTPEQTATLDKLDGLGSSASKIDLAVANHITQAELEAAVLDSGNITPEQAEIITEVGTKFTKSVNLYDKTKTIKDKYINNAGLLIDYVGRQTSDKIYVNPSVLYSFNQKATYFCVFDASDIKVDYKYNITSYTTPSNASYIMFSDNDVLMQSDMQFEKGVSTAYQSYGTTISADTIKNFSSEVQNSIINNGFIKPKAYGNLYNKDSSVVGVLINTSGGFSVNATTTSSDYIEVKPNTNYIANDTIISSAFYDENKIYISNSTGYITSLITPSNAKYIRLSSTVATMSGKFKFEKGKIKTKYVSYKEAFTTKNIDLSNTPTVITVSFSNPLADFTGRRAIQDALDSITDADVDNRYLIDVWDGVFAATEVAHYDKVEGAMITFIQGKSFVDIKGRDKDKCFIVGTLPSNLGTSFGYLWYQPVLWNCDEAKLSGFTIIAENNRYPIHIDSLALNSDTKQFIDDCKIIHRGTSGDALNWVNYNPIGLGTTSGQFLLVENSIISSVSVHNNVNFINPSIVKYKNCSITGNSFNSATNNNALTSTSLGSNQNDKLIIDGCSIDCDYPVLITADNFSTLLSSQKADRVEVEIIARHNKPLAVSNNTLTGKGLKITSKSMGSSSSVLFDESSTAFPLIISNGLNSVSYKNRYLRDVIYGYETFKGGNGLSGYAIGSLATDEIGVGSSHDVYISSLGKRLGDCSIVNKTLTVIVDGTSYNIIFNKNYNGTTSTAPSTYTNAQIIAEITAVIGSVATLEEYVVGKDYYPLFKGNTVKTNADTTEILAGMGVVYNGFGTIRKATNADGRIDGIALDNCIVGGTTRIITCGQIYSRNSGQRFSIQQSTNTATTYGTKLGMSATAGIFEIGATPTLLNGVGANIVEMVK